MTSLISKIKKNINEMGLPTSLLYIFSKLINRIHKNVKLHYYLFVNQKIAANPRLPVHRGKNFTFKILDKYATVLEALPRPREVIHNRFNQGYICIAATKEDIFVGCIWLSLHQYIEDEVRAIFIPQPIDTVAWDFDVFITSEYRATYLFPKLWDEADNYLKSLGFQATASRIAGFNMQSVNSHKRLGAETTARAIYIKAFNLQLSLCTVSPYLHLSCSEKSVPKYQLKSKD